jgi:hypothetical protein
MKHQSLLWLLATASSTSPLANYNHDPSFNSPILHFDSTRKFHITMFNDLHLGDGARPGTDEKTIAVMTKVLDAEPATNLVVLNGDLTSCEWIGSETVNSVLDKFIDPLLNRSMPFAATFGNHDMSATCNTRSMSQHIEERANMEGRRMTWMMDSVGGGYEDVGTSNYYVPVYSGDDAGDVQLKMVLWFFDSKGGRRYQPGGVDVSVADWVDQKVS